MIQDLWNLCVGMFRAGILGYGGGPSAIPLVQVEVVDRFKWMTASEFGEILAIANALPGPIATKMSAYVGYRVAGWPGALVALFAMVGPTVLAMVAIYAFLSRFSTSPVVKGMVSGVRPVIFVLLALLAWDYLPDGTRSVAHAVIAVVTLVAMKFLGLHPGWMVAAALVYGGIALR